MPSATNSFSRSIPRALRRSSARSRWAAPDGMSVTFPLFAENIAEVLSQFRRYRPAIVAACRSPLPPPPTVPPPGPPYRTILRARDKPYTNAREKGVESRHVACRRRAWTRQRRTTCANCAACTDKGSKPTSSGVGRQVGESTETGEGGGERR